MNKKIIITGSTSGIGKALAKKLIDQGAEVIGIARNHDKVAEFGKNYHPYQVDFNQTSDLEQQFKAIRAAHADIDAIVCCGGYGDFKEIEQFSFADMQSLMNVNFLSQALLIKTFISELRKRADTKVIFLGSECALTGQKKGSMYCASKFALRGFAQSLRAECATADVAVTIVNPGFVMTPFFDKLQFRPGGELNHSIEPEQITSMLMMVLAMTNNCVVEEITCQPLKKKVQTGSGKACNI